MTHIDIAMRDGFQTVRMNWTKKVPGFQRESFEIVRRAIQAADASRDVHCTIFLGTPSCFCLGTDALTFADSNSLADLALSVESFFKQLIQSRKPLIAAVDGNAVGLGMTMLLHFDAVYATPQSTFRAPFAEWGLVPEAASSLMLPSLVGHLRAFDMFCLGGSLDAEQALACGLVTTLAPSDHVEEVAYAAARRIVKLPPKAVDATRSMLRNNRSALQRRAALETASFQKLLADEMTQRRLKVMGRASRLALAS